MTGEGTIGMHYRLAPETVTAAWATSAAMGPEPWVAFLDAVTGGRRRRRGRRRSPTSRACRCRFPDFADFDKYNIQLEKARIEAAGYTRLWPAARAVPRPAAGLELRWR